VKCPDKCVDDEQKHQNGIPVTSMVTNHQQSVRICLS
jgi:hypothetical protein